MTRYGVVEILSKVIHFYVLLADSEHLISPREYGKYQELLNFPKKVKQWWVGSIYNTWKIRKRIEIVVHNELMKYKRVHNTSFSLWNSISHVNRTFI